MRFVLILVSIYFAAYLYFFWQTPLGMEPVLDGAENILLSQQIYDGTLPHEPFFRSMLYPAILAFFRIFGINNDSIMVFVGVFGLFIHLLGTYLVFYLANIIWENKICSYTASLIYGFYPPIIFYAAEPLDAVFSYVILLASLTVFFKACKQNEIKYFIFSGILMGISVLARSNCLPAAVIFIYEFKLTKKIPKSLVVLILSLILNGVIGYFIGGEFKLMPWQGAYNLYAANNITSNGKFYRNTVDVSNRKLGINPSRKESEIKYTVATGKQAADDLNEFNRFWYKQTYNEITSNFKNWIKLNLIKLYYLFNDFEQYNNKTFSYHKSLSPILKYNPLSFGIIMVMFALTLSLLNREDYSDMIKLCLIALFFLSLGIVAFYVSGRFRLMLVPMLIPFSVGFIKQFRKKEKKSFYLYLIPIFMFFLTFSSYCNANDTTTYKDDMLLTAFASSRLGMLEEQVSMAKQVLNIDSQNTLAARLILSGTINLVLSNLNYKLNLKSISGAIVLLRQRNLFYKDTVLMDLFYSFHEHNFLQIYRDLKQLPYEQFVFLPILLYVCMI